MLLPRQTAQGAWNQQKPDWWFTPLIQLQVVQEFGSPLEEFTLLSGCERLPQTVRSLSSESVLSPIYFLLSLEQRSVCCAEVTAGMAGKLCYTCKLCLFLFFPINSSKCIVTKKYNSI